MQFIAIDVETPNKNQDSICAIGALRFINGISDNTQFVELINPETQFDERNIGIHHIRPDQIQDKPCFKDIWPTLRDYIDDSILVAHNAKSTERSILNKCLLKIGQREIKNKFLCTQELSEVILLGAEKYGLSDLSNDG